MPPTKTAKKPTKKIADPVSAPDAKKFQKDSRRAYEHLGRVQTLLGLLQNADAERVRQLVPLAQAALHAGQAKESADLLRAAEHLSFGSLRLADAPDHAISAALTAGIHEEVEHQKAKSEEHGNAAKSPKPLKSLFKYMAETASEALASGRYRAALEFARGAEALTHLEHLSPLALASETVPSLSK